MSNKPFLIIHILIFVSFFNTYISAENLKIIPLKKPSLEKDVIKKMVEQGIIRPKPKPKDEKIKIKKIIEKVKKKEKEKLVSEQAPPKIVKKEKPDTVPLPN